DQLRPAGDDLPAGHPAARRRRDHPGEPDRRRGLLPSAHRQSASQPRPRQPAPCGHRPHGGERRGGRRGLGGDGPDLARPRRADRAEHHGGPSAGTAAAAAPPAAAQHGAGALTAAMSPRIFRNFGVKVVSIALAVLLWGLVAGQREAERALRIPLEYRNIPEHLELISEPDSLVDVRVRGSSSLLGELRAADLVAVLDLRTAREGRRLFHLLPSDVNVPAGVDVLQVTPSTVSLTFEESAARIV